MTALKIVATSGEKRTIDESAVSAFRSGLRGRSLLPNDEGYNEARTVWNAMIDRRPAIIARCAGAADVIHCVNFARAHNLLISVRGGGHSVAGNAICEDGLLIDLSPMKGLRVDPQAKTARAEAGVLWGEMDREAQSFGLATTGGFVPTTGIAGLTLGGGFGYLMRSCGLSCDNLLEVDVVTADGRLLKANAETNLDLFWGLRGGGGNFGIATSFKYRLHPVGPIVLGGMILFPITEAKKFGIFYRDFCSTAPDELTAHLGFVFSPDGHPMTGLLVCYNGAVEKAEKLLRPVREFGNIAADMIAPMPYVALQALGGNLYPPGRYNYWKSNLIGELSENAIEIVATHFPKSPSPFAAIAFEQLGGAVAKVDKNATAFGERTASHSLIISTGWVDKRDAERNIDWARNVWKELQPFSEKAVYVNYLDAGEEERVKDAYGAEKFEKLRALKRKYDPSNFFRMNNNIRP